MSTLVFVVEFESSVVLRENVTTVKEDETPTGVTYTFDEIVAVKPSGKLKPLKSLYYCVLNCAYVLDIL